MFSVLRTHERRDWTLRKRYKLCEALRDLRRDRSIKEHPRLNPKYYFHCKEVISIAVNQDYMRVDFTVDGGPVEEKVDVSLPFIISAGQRSQLVTLIKNIV